MLASGWRWDTYLSGWAGLGVEGAPILNSHLELAITVIGSVPWSSNDSCCI